MARPKTFGDNVAAPPAAIVQAVGEVLRPLVGLLLDHGLSLPILVGMLKATYVKVAEGDFRIDAQVPSDSRISVLTGVHRKDVRRLRRAGTPENSPPKSVSIGGQILVQWNGRPEFQDARHRPRRLPRLKRDGGAASFEALVESVSKDVGARTILDELLRLGIVEIDRRDRVYLKVSAFVPRHGLEEKAYYFGKNVRDHLAAAAHNLHDPKQPMLERSVHFADLSSATIEALARIAERSGMSALKQVNRNALAMKQRDRADRRGGQRMNFGIYFYREPESTPQAGKQEPKKRSSKPRR